MTAQRLFEKKAGQAQAEEQNNEMSKEKASTVGRWLFFLGEARVRAYRYHMTLK